MLGIGILGILDRNFLTSASALEAGAAATTTSWQQSQLRWRRGVGWHVAGQAARHNLDRHLEPDHVCPVARKGVDTEPTRRAREAAEGSEA